MELQLTEEEKKILKKFFLYIRSFGGDNASIDYYFEYDSIAYDSGLHVERNKKIDFSSFPVVENITQRILEQVDTDDFESDFHDNDVDYYTIEIEFKAKDKEIRVSCEYRTLATEDAFSENELDTDNETFKRYLEQGVDEIICEYTGGGDSGYIEGTMAVDGEQETTASDIEDICYNQLSEFGGWEINEGSQGNIVFNLADKTVTVNHQWNTEESNEFDLLNIKI